MREVLHSLLVVATRRRRLQHEMDDESSVLDGLDKTGLVRKHRLAFHDMKHQHCPGAPAHSLELRRGGFGHCGVSHGRPRGVGLMDVGATGHPHSLVCFTACSSWSPTSPPHKGHLSVGDSASSRSASCVTSQSLAADEPPSVVPSRWCPHRRCRATLMRGLLGSPCTPGGGASTWRGRSGWMSDARATKQCDTRQAAVQ